MFFTVSIPYSSGGNSNRKKMKEEKNKMILFQSLIHQGEKSTKGEENDSEKMF